AAHYSSALRHAASLERSARAELIEQHARECSLANQTEEAIESAQRAIACWRELGNTEAQSRMLSLVAEEYRNIGDKASADRSITEAIALAEALPRGATLASAYGTRSALASNRGWDNETLEFGRRALALARDVGDFATEAHSLGTIGSGLLGINDRS